ncbi:heterokaryon incompatibility protein-domain-containing protein [Podospora didyma]|uniref:Heterokaryon incompatibility protein-domain-containing protein n=1 Tax=Podospora didyma TaxID=330526 RepID=A0AAE0NXE3_9PEZI|nr:heterokaryon incompatibility protein-domain-containing protein [Podospora didyma]
MALTSNLCPCCLSIFSQPLPEYQGYTGRIDSPGYVYRSSRTRLSQSPCPLCIQIWDFVQRKEQEYGSLPMPIESDGDKDSDEIEVWLAHLGGSSGSGPTPLAAPDPRCSLEEVRFWQSDGEPNKENWYGVKIWIASERYPYDLNDRFDFAADHGTRAALYISSRPRPANLKATFDIIKQWMQQCDSQHVFCAPGGRHGAGSLLQHRDSNGPPPQETEHGHSKGVILPPKRLLYLPHSNNGGGISGSGDVSQYPDGDRSSNGDTIRLIDTTTEAYPTQNPYRYLALSYCWGPDPSAQLKTTKANLSDHLSNIPVASLPAAIREAVIATRRLGVDYLWVDAVCIVQDDAADRDGEIARMGAIYAGAYCTLTASGAAHCDDGFLEKFMGDYKDCQFFDVPRYYGAAGGDDDDRKDLQNPVVGVKMSPLGGRSEWGGATDDWTRRNLLRRGHETLHTRGWTFQETFLSPRLLVWSAVQPYWICREAFWSCGDPQPDEYLQQVRLTEWLELRNHISGRLPSVGQNTSYDAATDSPVRSWPWAAVVQGFSLRRLTFLGDKTLALHAVREAFSQQIGREGDYAVGLFRSNASVDLLWHTSYGAEPATRLSEFPSWSWMSFDGGVGYHQKYSGTREENVEKHVDFAVVEWPQCDRFGRILLADAAKGGRTNNSNLKLAGLAKEVAIYHRNWKDGRASAQDMPCSAIRVLQLGTDENEADGDMVGHITFDEYRMPSSNDDFDNSPPSRYKTFGCLLVAMEKRSEDDEEEEEEEEEEGDGQYKGCFGIVIAPAATAAGHFQRIGFFKGHLNSVDYFQDAVKKEYAFV